MTTKFTNPLNNIKIASPCRADWNEMIGDERKRFCGECQLNVYNLSGMTRAEAEELLINAEGRLCVRFYKRADGSVLTEDCPVGWRRVKQRASKMAAAAASLVFGAMSGLGLTAFFNQSSSGQSMGRLVYEATPKATPKNTPEPLMGAVAISTPTPKVEPKEVVMDEMYAPTPKPKKDMKVLIEKVVKANN